MKFLKNFSISEKLFAGLAVLLIALLLLLKKTHSQKMEPKTEIANNILNRLLFEGFNLDTAKMIVAQSAFETGNFESKIFKENNNAFGMKEAKIRKTTAIGTQRNHALYASLEDSIKDYRLYWDNFKYPSAFAGLKEFVETLKANKYFEAGFSHYLSGVEHYYKKYYAE